MTEPTYAELEASVEKAGDYFVAEFVEWVLGDFTVPQFAKYRNKTVSEIELSIGIGSKIYTQRHEDAKIDSI
jgi:hypothetical protein